MHAVFCRNYLPKPLRNFPHITIHLIALSSTILEILLPNTTLVTLPQYALKWILGHVLSN